MKQSQKQNVIININKEIIKPKKKRTYKKKNDDLLEDDYNIPNTTYNPNILPKNNTTPSYGLKSINPSFENTSAFSNILMDRLNLPEPRREQYVEQLRTPNVVNRPVVPPTPLSPIQHFPNNINQHPIPKPKPIPRTEIEEIQEIEPYNPRRLSSGSRNSSILNSDAFEAIKENEENRTILQRSFDFFSSPFRRKKNNKVSDFDIELGDIPEKRGRGREGNYNIQFMTPEQVKKRLAYLRTLERSGNLSSKDANFLKILRKAYPKS